MNVHAQSVPGVYTLIGDGNDIYILKKNEKDKQLALDVDEC